MKTTSTIRQEIEAFLEGKKLESITLYSADRDGDALLWDTTDYSIYYDSDAGKYLYETGNDTTYNTQAHVVFRAAADIAKALTYKSVEAMTAYIVTDSDKTHLRY